jgi:hypothetical protein
MRDQRCLQVLESEAEILTEKNPTTSLSFPPFVLPRPAGLVAIACLRKKKSGFVGRVQQDKIFFAVHWMKRNSKADSICQWW